MPDIGTPADALQETILYRAYLKAKTTYTKEFEQVGCKNLSLLETFNWNAVY